MSHFQQWSKASATERRTMVQAEVRRTEEYKQNCFLFIFIWLTKLGKNRRPGWSGTYQSESWHRQNWRKDQFRISFLLIPVYDTLLSPVKLHQWDLFEDPNCKLCGKRGTMVHILSVCQLALTQGRYRWRHDKVLRGLVDALEVKGERKDQQTRSKDKYSFEIGWSNSWHKSTKAEISAR